MTHSRKEKHKLTHTRIRNHTYTYICTHTRKHQHVDADKTRYRSTHKSGIICRNTHTEIIGVSIYQLHPLSTF